MKHCRTIAVISLLLVAVLSSGIARAGTAATLDRLLLLVPDEISLTDTRVNMWLDAAAEEGLHVVPMHDSEFIRPFFEEPPAAGVILPDSIHKQASDAFVAAVRRFVAGGGRLMLVYDAGTLSPEVKYAPGRSRLSDLAGVDYALYESLKDKTIEWANVGGEIARFRELGIPPGQYYPFNGEAAEPKPNTPAAESSQPQLRRYEFGDVKYPSFVTGGSYAGQMILHSAAGIVAGEHKYEKGSVLFVNLPLGYLKGNTDGLLLHAFLKYFAEHTLTLPYLMAIPDGIGGLVLNWHVDSNAAIRPMQELASWAPLQEQGPYSIHITAGPDAKTFDDHLGFDAEHNPVSSELILHYVRLGNTIGSHGGWIHDYFSAHVETGNLADLEPLLAMNKSTLEHVSGKPVVEYSAPNGDQPPWVTQWLEAHGFVAHYFTGNAGMGPTQGYRDSVRESQNMWEFPVLHLDRAAAFEEMKPEGYSDAEVQSWLEAIADFAASRHTVRLVYFHPPGILTYKTVVMNWLELTTRLKAEGRFRWYTMTDMANFLNSRKQVEWSLSEKDGVITLDALHPQSLEHQSWRFAAARFSKPRVVQGSAEIKNDGESWIVVAGNVTHIQTETELIK
jgi:hypothetical protein